MRNKFFKNFAIVGMVLVVLALIAEIVYHSISYNNGKLTINDFILQVVISVAIYSLCFILLLFCVKFRNNRK